VENRKEYDENEPKTCPKCDSADLNRDDAPDLVICESCGLQFRIKTGAIWNE